MNGKTDKRSDVKIEPPRKVAAGLPAIVETVRHVVGKAGLYRGTAALLKVNQLSGFDCPGCAWPEPAAGRKHAEFCENGAKAGADEAMQTCIDGEFFARWSVAQGSIK